MFSLVFFGSFQDYSLEVLKTLHKHPNFTIKGVISTPPRPGNRGLIQKTAVHQYSKLKKLPLFPLENLDQIPDTLKDSSPDFLLVAGYGQLIPSPWLSLPRFEALNIHPSLLPHYPGRFPAEWAILRQETQTGVTLLKLSSRFDKGEIAAQSTIPILPTDTRKTLYQKLFRLGAKLTIDTLPKIAKGEIKFKPQPQGKYFYARQLTRLDGFLPWDSLWKNLSSPKISRLLRALSPWPGVWTLSPRKKRLKLLSLDPPIVQLEGKKPVAWDQIRNEI